MENDYARAIYSILKKGTSEDEVFEALKKHLTDTGRMKLLPRILEKLKALQARTKASGTQLEVASEGEAASATSAAAALGFESADVVVNPALISGWRARKGSVLVDMSAKRALVDLYRRIAS